MEEKKRGKISEFFYHLIAYSIFNYSNGNIFLFNNPYTFIPLKSLATLQKELRSITRESDALIEWLGRVDGRTAALAMVSRYGMKKSLERKNVEKLVSGATLTGLGDLKLDYLSPEGVKISCASSPLAEVYKSRYGVSKKPVDSYIMGALAGADMPIFHKTAIASEVKCIGKGDDSCVYDIHEGKYTPPIIIQKSLGKSADHFMSTLSESFLKRINKFSISMRSKNIKFGDGNFSFNGVNGISIPIFVWVLLNEILSKKDEVSRKKFLEKVSKSYIEALSEVVEKKEVHTLIEANSLLDSLSMFGFGRFKAVSNKNGVMRIVLEKNNFGEEYMHIFGMGGLDRDYLLTQLIKDLFDKLSNYSKVVCSEITCVHKRAKQCTFRLSFSS